MKDAAGMTLAEVEQLSLEEQFVLAGERYAHVQELLLEAQLVISDGEWEWSGSGVLPSSGAPGGVPGSMPGTVKTSYYFSEGRITYPEGAAGDVADLEPMRAHFEAQGWEVGLMQLSDEHTLTGYTGDGYQVQYLIQSSGIYSIRVFSELFWTTDYSSLLRAVGSRVRAGFPERTQPGVVDPYPKWSDPIIDPNPGPS